MLYLCDGQNDRVWHNLSANVWQCHNAFYRELGEIRANWSFTATGSFLAFLYSPASVEKNLLLLEGTKDCPMGIVEFSGPSPPSNLPRLIRATSAKSTSYSVTSAIGLSPSYAMHNAIRPRVPEPCSTQVIHEYAASRSVVMTNSIIVIRPIPQKELFCVRRGRLYL